VLVLLLLLLLVPVVLEPVGQWKELATPASVVARA
jgi:hypothetical protein